jgi:hypothetical protein
MLPRSIQKQLTIPEELQSKLLPSNTFTVNQLLEFHLPVERTSTIFTQPDQYLSLDPINYSQFNAIKILTPPTSVIEALSRAVLSMDETDTIQSIQCPHASAHSRERYPLWLLTFWSELIHVRVIKRQWEQALQYLANPDTKLRNNRVSEEKANMVCQEIRALPWNAPINGFDNQGQLIQLHTYCSQDWLSSVHIDHMLNLLKNDLGIPVNNTIPVQHAWHAQQILATYYYGTETYLTSKSCYALCKQAQDLAMGIQDMLATVANIDGNHWIALMVDFQKKKVYYRNSLKHAINKEIRAAYDWWLSMHNEDMFEWAQMEITRQQDSYSCRIFAVNALAHALDSRQFNLMNPEAVDAERINILYCVISRH